MRIVAYCLTAGAVGLCLLSAAAGLPKAEAREFVRANSALMLAVANGQVLREAVTRVETQKTGLLQRLAHDALNRLADQEVLISGSVTSVSCPTLSLAQHKVRVMIASAYQQPINIDCLVARHSNTVAGLQPGRAVAFRGRLSRAWRIIDKTPTLEDAELVDQSLADRLKGYLPFVERELPGDRVMLPRPFEKMAIAERRRLCEMARCAVSAYPKTTIPRGYRAFSPAEWTAVATDCGFAQESYTNDGFLILGNGLRGRLLVSQSSLRTVIAWSGCDLDEKGFSSNGAADFGTAAKHILSGHVQHQFEQAARICRSVLKVRKGPLWVVGHSLGASLTAYSILSLDAEGAGRLAGATFNGLGVAPSIVKRMSVDAKRRAGQRLIDIYCDQDPIREAEQSGNSPLLGGLRLCSVHFGRPYYMPYKPATKTADEGAFTKLLRAHSIVVLASRMQAITPPDRRPSDSGGAFLVVFGLIVFGIVVVVIFRLRRCPEGQELSD